MLTCGSSPACLCPGGWGQAHLPGSSPHCPEAAQGRRPSFLLLPPRARAHRHVATLHCCVVYITMQSRERPPPPGPQRGLPSPWRQVGGVQGISVLLTSDPRFRLDREQGQGRAWSSQSPAPPMGPGPASLPNTHGHTCAHRRMLTYAHSRTHPSSARDGFPAQKLVPPGVSGRNLHHVFPEPRDEGLRGPWETGPLSIAVLRVCPSWYPGSRMGARQCHLVGTVGTAQVRVLGVRPQG